MKHIFVINPTAGKSDSTEFIREQLKKTCADKEYEIYVTKAPGDTSEFVDKRCASDPDDIRFYACGGDGTLNGVVNGAAPHKNASVSCYPCGSGNDFVKYYGGKERFLDLRALMEAEDELIDVMEVNGKYCVNVCNFGFDTAVAKTISKNKTKPFMGGKNAYYAGVVHALIHAMKTDGTVKVDGEEFFSGSFLLCTIANGTYVGSSFKCAPRSENNDGLMEVCLVKTISRPKFVSLIGSYTKGEHLDDPRFDSCILYRRGKTIEISSDTPGFAYTLDGEIVENSSFTVNTLATSLRFAVPKISE